MDWFRFFKIRVGENFNVVIRVRVRFTAGQYLCVRLGVLVRVGRNAIADAFQREKVFNFVLLRTWLRFNQALHFRPSATQPGSAFHHASVRLRVDWIRLLVDHLLGFFLIFLTVMKLGKFLRAVVLMFLENRQGEDDRVNVAWLNASCVHPNSSVVFSR